MRSYLRALSQLMLIYRAAVRDPRMQILLTLGLCVLGTGTVVFHFVEGWSWLDAAYFSTVTIATVGFGDLHPVTTIGKLFVMLYIFVGVGIFVAIFAFLSNVDIEKLTADQPDNADTQPKGGTRATRKVHPPQKSSVLQPQAGVARIFGLPTSAR